MPLLVCNTTSRARKLDEYGQFSIICEREMRIGPLILNFFHFFFHIDSAKLTIKLRAALGFQGPMGALEG